VNRKSHPSGLRESRRIIADYRLGYFRTTLVRDDALLANVAERTGLADSTSVVSSLARRFVCLDYQRKGLASHPRVRIVAPPSRRVTLIRQIFWHVRGGMSDFLYFSIVMQKETNADKCVVASLQRSRDSRADRDVVERNGR